MVTKNSFGSKISNKTELIQNFLLKSADPDRNFSRCPDAVPVCLLLSDLQLAAVCGGAVIRIVKVAVLVEDESYVRVVAMWIRKNVSDPGKFGFSIIGIVSRDGFGF